MELGIVGDELRQRLKLRQAELAKRFQAKATGIAATILARPVQQTITPGKLKAPHLRIIFG
jgi:hypothetical protein